MRIRSDFSPIGRSEATVARRRRNTEEASGRRRLGGDTARLPSTLVYYYINCPYIKVFVVIRYIMIQQEYAAKGVKCK